MPRKNFDDENSVVNEMDRMIRQTEFVCSVMFCYIIVFSMLLFTILGKKNIIHYEKCFITEVYSLFEDLPLRHKQMFVSCGSL